MQRCIIGKEFDITIKIINNIVYVYKGTTIVAEKNILILVEEK
jgi:hypothetical protein